MLTARQYGEVVLPDAASGQGPDSLARKLSRCKEGMARVFAVRVQILLSITRVAVQAISEPENCHGARFKLRTDARIRVHKSYKYILGAGAKAKTVTSNLPILSVL
jgi:hypothetical protein